MGDSSCKICGSPAPAGQRYCNGCDFQARADGRGATPADTPRRASLERERGSLSIFLLVFLVAAGGTVGMGLTASDGFSLPAIRQSLGLAESGPAALEAWGEVRFVHKPTRIRAGRSTDSAVVGSLMPGDSVRADFVEGNWYAVFPVDATERDPERAMGFVYGPLLKPSPPGGV